jgi:hypothetical protein
MCGVFALCLGTNHVLGCSIAKQNRFFCWGFFVLPRWGRRSVTTSTTLCCSNLCIAVTAFLGLLQRQGKPSITRFFFFFVVASVPRGAALSSQPCKGTLCENRSVCFVNTHAHQQRQVKSQQKQAKHNFQKMKEKRFF